MLPDGGGEPWGVRGRGTTAVPVRSTSAHVCTRITQVVCMTSRRSHLGGAEVMELITAVENGRRELRIKSRIQLRLAARTDSISFLKCADRPSMRRGVFHVRRAGQRHGGAWDAECKDDGLLALFTHLTHRVDSSSCWSRHAACCHARGRRGARERSRHDYYITESLDVKSKSMH